MSSSNNSFHKQQLLPQEENLRWAEKKRSFIGIPKTRERRICLTPDAVNSLSSMGIG
jgi:hypothetical protein